ncbi:MAG: hypothetical protein C0488_10380 [Arthrobacter sp.]|nr:hypothetical protein [Arthrobacter sp.]
MAEDLMEPTVTLTTELALQEQALQPSAATPQAGPSPCPFLAQRQSVSRCPPSRSTRQTPARGTLPTITVTKEQPVREASKLRLLSLIAPWTTPRTTGMTGQQTARKTMSQRCIRNQRLPRCSPLADWTGRSAAPATATLAAHQLQTWVMRAA